MPEYNDKGQVALFYLQPIPKLVQLPNGHNYGFTVCRSISLAWVDPVDVPAIFDIKPAVVGIKLIQPFDMQVTVM